MSINENITAAYCTRLVSNWNRFGYPDRVLEVAQMYLAGTATEADTEEMYELIALVQATWATTTEEN
jgi:hypothetical protein